MALPNPLQPFTWGAGGAAMTPEEIARQREIASALIGQGVDTSPVGDWTQGAARVLEALSGGLKNRRADKAEAANSTTNSSIVESLLQGGTSGFPAAPAAASPATGQVASSSFSAPADIKDGIASTAQALGIDPVDLATAISYETGGTFDPTKAGPTTQWGQHKGLIQFGEPQAKQYGVDWENPVGSQLGPDGAVAKYLRATGVQPGMGLLDIYSAINAGGVGKYGASDANNGGAPGTVRDKVEKQMAAHRAKALAMFGTDQQPAVAAIDDMAGPAQVASLDPAIGMAQTRQVPLQPGQNVSSSPDAQRVIEALTSPQSMTGGAPMAMQPQQVAQAQDLSQIPVMAGGTADAIAPGKQGINPAIIQALSNPAASPQTQKIAQMLLAPMLDPNAGLETEYKRAQIKNIESEIAKRNDPNARDKFGNSVIWGQDEEGNWVAMQPSSGGGLVPADTHGIKLAPPGIGQMNLGTTFAVRDRAGNVINSVPIDNSGKARDTAVGTQQGGQIAAAPADIQAGQNAMDFIGAIRSDPNIDIGTGFSHYGNAVSGTPGYDFQNKVNQAKSGAFLSAIAQMRGLGSLSNAEGETATAAVNRMDTATSKQEFLKALDDYQKIVEQGMDRAQRRLNGDFGPPEATASPAQTLGTTGQPADQGGVATPTNDEEYNALPSGAMFIDPDDGKTYRKP